MNEREERDIRKYVIMALTIFLVGWGVLIFFENAFFAAPAFGVPIPSWAAWVGNLSFAQLNIIDTAGAAALILVIVLSRWWVVKRRHRNSRGSVSGWVLLAILLLVIGGVLFLVFGITLPALLNGIRGFLGLH